MASAAVAPSRTIRDAQGGLSCSLWARALMLALVLGLARAAPTSRGWLVHAKSKDEAHEHVRRSLLEHQEYGHEVMESWWQDFKGYFEKQYASVEAEAKGFEAFKHNMRLVHEINGNPILTFWASGNQFSDLRWDEFKAKHLAPPGSLDLLPGSREANETKAVTFTQTTHHKRALLQSSYDWRDHGVETPVRNQGSCNACWVMAGVHALEAAYQIFEGWSTPVQLSPQQALDCYDVGSCQWGNAAEMMRVATKQPLTTEGKYPLFSDKTGSTGGCRSDVLANLQSGQAVELAGTAGFERLEGVAEDELISKTLINPLIMHYEVDESFMMYSGGVYSAGKCSGTQLNHALVATGFDRGANWWLFKNSWGANWGDDGYVRIKMIGGQGTCGLYRWAFRPGKEFSQRLASGRKARKPKSARRLASTV